ncbi:MAG: hypothetical protein D6780_07360 [Candidatus Dadabacteria bacterium]|nr:MAG: hypothetical protein D6780_07360 [Candidatus Dadabacteria bacterium]
MSEKTRIDNSSYRYSGYGAVGQYREDYPNTSAVSGANRRAFALSKAQLLEEPTSFEDKLLNKVVSGIKKVLPSKNSILGKTIEAFVPVHSWLDTVGSKETSLEEKGAKTAEFVVSSAITGVGFWGTVKLAVIAAPFAGVAGSVTAVAAGAAATYLVARGARFMVNKGLSTLKNIITSFRD